MIYRILKLENILLTFWFAAPSYFFEPFTPFRKTAPTVPKL